MNEREEIINKILKRRKEVHDNMIKRGEDLNQNGYHPIIKAAFDFYRGAEYELNNLLDWLGYEE